MSHNPTLRKYICTDCGHDWEQHNSFIVPYGCSVVDGTSIDCVNGYQGDRPGPSLRSLEAQIKALDDDKKVLETLWQAEAQRELDEMAAALGLTDDRRD